VDAVLLEVTTSGKQLFDVIVSHLVIQVGDEPAALEQKEYQAGCSFSNRVHGRSLDNSS
jgi:hypothetical protein